MTRNFHSEDDEPIKKTDLGFNWTSFTKSPYLQNQVWEDDITPHYNQDFLVQSWGRPYSTSICNGRDNKTSNIETMSYQGYGWRDTQDHAKWGVSAKGEVCCIGDLNRMDSQEYRGGTIACIEDAGLCKAFKSLIKTDDCQLSNQ